MKENYLNEFQFWCNIKIYEGGRGCYQDIIEINKLINKKYVIFKG